MRCQRNIADSVHPIFLPRPMACMMYVFKHYFITENYLEMTKVFLRSKAPVQGIGLAQWFFALVTVVALLAPRASWAQETQVDLVLTVNGSGSISPADFDLQQEGIRQALLDDVLFPRNGTIGFAVVQYAAGQTVVQVPYTIIDDENDIANIIAQIEDIVQIQGSTNPGDGINAAMDIITAEGSPNSEKVICLSTDGLPNSGASVSDALADAEAEGLDRFTVIAIEDPGNFGEADFQNFYGPLIIGNGAVTVARNSIEYANFLGSTCLFVNTQLVALEVVQSIQDWENSVTLVAHKPTYVRAHLQTPGGGMGRFSARLRGYGPNMQELPESPLTASNETKFDIDGDALARRADIEGSLLFALPDSWTEGTIVLELEGAGAGVECLEDGGSSGDCMEAVSFVPTNRMEVKYFKVDWVNSAGNTFAATDADVTEMRNRLEALFPIDEVQILTDELDIGQSDGALAPDFSRINFELYLRRILDLNFFSGPIYYGIVNTIDPIPSGAGLTYGRAGFYLPTFGSVSAIPGYVSSGLKIDANTAGYSVQSHEIGHNLGRHHAVNSSLGFLTFGGEQYKQGWCGEVASLDAPDFPYSINGRATMGPGFDGPYAEIWGYDSNRKLLAVPNANYELMSYCGFANDNWQFISDFTYEGIRSRINNLFDPANNSNLLATEDYQLFYGALNVANDELISFSSNLLLDAPVLPDFNSGEYTMVALDENGNEIRSLPFDVLFLDSESAPGTVDTAYFAVPFEKSLDIAEVRIFKDGGSNLIHICEGSPNPPTIELLSPNGGDTINTATLTVEWNSFDLDGDPLLHTIQYSPDNGGSWLTLAEGIIGSSYTLNTRRLAGTSNGLIRVICSDEVNTTFDECDAPFFVANKAPVCDIAFPAAGQEYVGVQPVVLKGFAIDKEEVELQGAQLEWYSDKDGLIATGKDGYIDASTLTDDTHLITLRATDAEGAVSECSVNISIKRLFFSPIEEVDILVTPENINPNQGSSVISISILSTPDFNAPAQIDLSTVKAGVPGASPLFSFPIARDAQGDGLPDLFMYFRLDSLEVACGDDKLALTSLTNSGAQVFGFDEITTIGCNNQPLQASPASQSLISGSYPNPFSEEVNIGFYLPEEGEVRIDIFDSFGRRVRTLADNAFFNRGQHQISWNGQGFEGMSLENGLYVYTIRSGSYTGSGKMLLVR